MKEMLTLRVELCGSRPTIWRTLDLESELSLAEAGHALQIAMGWENVHPQAFHSRSPHEPWPSGERVTWNDAEHTAAPDGRDLELSTLAQAFGLAGAELYYEYGLGDGWLHRVVLEGRRAARDDEPRMQVLAGAMRAPIEDSGGIGGWQGKLDIIAAKDVSRDYERVLEWMQWRVGPMGSIDPGRFDLEKARRMMALHDAGYQGPTVLGWWLQRVPSGTERFFGRMIAETELSLDPVYAKPAWLDMVLEPFAVLIHLCEGQGIKLTTAGWMPRKVVGQLVSACRWSGIDFERGATKHERTMATVSWLRDISLELGLICKNKGRLMATHFGRDMARSQGELPVYLLECLISGMDSKVHRDCQITQWITEEMGIEGFAARTDTINAMLGALHYADAQTGGPLTRASYAPTSALWHLIDRAANFHFSLPDRPNTAARREAMQGLRRYLLSGFQAA